MSSKPGQRRTPSPVHNPSRTRSSSRWWVIGGVVAVLAVAVVIAVAAGGGDDSSGSSDAVQETARVEVDGTALPQFPGNQKSDPAVGDIVPTLVGEGFDAAPVTIEPTGKPMVIMFLAHWCPHCQAEVPRIVELAKGGAFDGIDVASVATATSSQQRNYPPSSWLEREQWPFTVLLDDEQSTAARAYGLSAYPFFVFVDGTGAVVGRATGEVGPSELEAALDALRDGTDLPPVGTPSA